ncbi:Hypothetical protein ORPV_676 [Orpheovirus IHUMI-LCC2]|uniref:Uncharacterized protein n=1 Tax=Orpheovirus IHUMI-LCC2 TaxID=2023057 RepID=A0A2I2L4Z7_9VIRU|nr:Hypothetical protein ORPV_676 [Orpheovirus IHUMI-LCC2]SNW62580.1 Hypothetical protein ORPV_676 [Orpheovirus IHUMI-LCC2]
MYKLLVIVLFIVICEASINNSYMCIGKHYMYKRKTCDTENFMRLEDVYENTPTHYSINILEVYDVERNRIYYSAQYQKQNYTLRYYIMNDVSYHVREEKTGNSCVRILLNNKNFTYHDMSNNFNNLKSKIYTTHTITASDNIYIPVLNSDNILEKSKSHNQQLRVM